MQAVFFRKTESRVKTEPVFLRVQWKF